MTQKLSKAQIRSEIERLEIKSKHAQRYSKDKSYPEESRNRFTCKIAEYTKEIKLLQEKLEKALDIPEDPPDIGPLTDDEEEEDTNLSDSRGYSEDDEEEDEYIIAYKDEIDFTDNKKALDTLNTLYPDGLDLD